MEPFKEERGTEEKAAVAAELTGDDTDADLTGEVIATEDIEDIWED